MTNTNHVVFPNADDLPVGDTSVGADDYYSVYLNLLVSPEMKTFGQRM